MSAGLQRFSQAARKTLALAHAEAIKSGQSKITDMHLFIALIRDEGSAGKVLAEQGANLEGIRSLVDQITPASEKTAGEPGRIDLDDSTKRVLEQAVEIGRQNKSGTIGSEHLLSALVKYGSSRVNRVLEASGLDRARIRESLDPVLAASRVQSELSDLLDMLEACRRLFQGEVTHQQRLNRIEEIVREYFSTK